MGRASSYHHRRMENPTVSRRVMWFVACVVGLPLIGLGIGTGRLWMIAVGILVALSGFYVSVRRHKCLACGYTVMAASATMTHCMKCGAPYKSGN
jgi:hypothetical protein